MSRPRSKRARFQVDARSLACATVGSASVQHFTELFRDETGTTPAAWRTSRR
jgi:AraC-like DNA-binding protein